RRHRNLLRRLALSELTGEDLAHLRQREQVGVEQRQHAVLVHLAQFVPTQLAQLLLVDHLEAAIDERLLVAFGLDRDLAVHQQAGLLYVLHEGGGALPRSFELFAEFEDRLGRVTRLVAVEQGLAVVELAHGLGRRVETQGQLVALRIELGEKERIAADVGRNVGGGIDRAPIGVEEYVDPLVEAHQGDRDRILADRKDDRIVPLRQAELIDGDRDRVGLRDERRLLHLSDFQRGVLGRVERHNLVVEQRQILIRRGARHCNVSPGVRPYGPSLVGPAGWFWRRALLTYCRLGKRRRFRAS